MFEQDYLMRVFIQFGEALRRSWFKARKDCDPRSAAAMLEEALSDAIEIDGSTLLSLAPASFLAILQVSATDPRIIEYVGRSLLLTSAYLRETNEEGLARLRLEQAQALSDAYDLNLPEDPYEMARLLEELSQSPDAAVIDLHEGNQVLSAVAEKQQMPDTA